MREIKFRGKRIDNGEWVYGYIFIGEKAWILQEKNQPGMVGLHPFKPIQVDPETVGQSIIFKDKNGKEIYEGDVLYHKYFCSPEFSPKYFEQEAKMEVKIPDFFYYLGRDTIQNSSESIEEFVAHMEVIGDIHS